jgi:hypothetical protein
MTSARAEQAERRAVITNEQKLRPGDQQPTTLHALSKLSNDLEGRASARDYVVGEAESVSYPRLPANSPWGDGPQPGLEPPLNYSVLDQEPNGTFAEVQASLSAIGAASVVAGNGAECAPALPVAVETSAPNSLISGASASEETKTAPEMRTGGAASYNGGQSHSPMHRSIRRL